MGLGCVHWRLSHCTIRMSSHRGSSADYLFFYRECNGEEYKQCKHAAKTSLPSPNHGSLICIELTIALTFALTHMIPPQHPHLASRVVPEQVLL